jgi:hypothetical protein
VCNKPPLEKLKPFIHESLFHLRYVLNAPESEVVINDKKIAYIKLLPNSEIRQQTMLVVNYPGCVEMFQNHFNKVWEQAREYNEAKLKV